MKDRFLAHADELGLTRSGARLLVALSGGCDSVALFHLLRFAAASQESSLFAAHFDHAMRPGSTADARWVAGLCRAWQVPILSGRADVPPRNETEARQARYQFLQTAAEQMGATHLLTAHHADDQAETVLFRILRGTGLKGLAGIAPVGPGNLVRPLLPFWRWEIRAFARQVGLRWRRDPSNQMLGPVRNRIRHSVLPMLESRLHSHAREHLVTLAELARESEQGWSELVKPIEATLIQRKAGSVLLLRKPWPMVAEAIQLRVLRDLLSSLGVVLDRKGTRVVLQFISQAATGREIHLPGGLRIAMEWEAVRFIPAAPRSGDCAGSVEQSLAIPSPAPDGGIVCINGRRYRVNWWMDSAVDPSGVHGGSGSEVAVRVDPTRFPLQVRGWRAGDRIRLSGGSKSLKKLFGERRVPRFERVRTPILVDAGGTILWVVKVQIAPAAVVTSEQEALWISIQDD